MTIDKNAPDSKPVIIDMPEHTGGDMGGTMRLGARKTRFVEQTNSKLFHLYGRKHEIDERHRHRYEVNPEYINDLESHGMRFVGKSVDSNGARMEIMELDEHPYFVGVQYHPEYLSRPLTPSPPYLGLVLAACGKLTLYLDASRSSSPVAADYAATNNDDPAAMADVELQECDDGDRLIFISQNAPRTGIPVVRQLLNQIKSFTDDVDAAKDAVAMEDVEEETKHISQ